MNTKKGFSLVELMIAMALGLFLIAGVSTIYISSKQTYKANDQTSELDENARTALRALTHHIEHAGYASTTGMKLKNYIIPTNATITPTNCADGQPNIKDVAEILTSSDGDMANGGDTIGLLFMGDESMRMDCTGSGFDDPNDPDDPEPCLPPQSPVRLSSLLYNSFSVASTGNNLAGDPIPALRCGGSRNPVSQPWAEGVENIQFQYGIDTDGNGSVENYRNATEVESANVWDQIISVRIGLLIRSVEPVYRDSKAEVFQILDELVSTDDRYKRGVYTTTIRLKNLARRI